MFVPTLVSVWTSFRTFFGFLQFLSVWVCVSVSEKTSPYKQLLCISRLCLPSSSWFQLFGLLLCEMSTAIWLKQHPASTRFISTIVSVNDTLKAVESDVGILGFLDDFDRTPFPTYNSSARLEAGSPLLRLSDNFDLYLYSFFCVGLCESHSFGTSSHTCRCPNALLFKTRMDEPQSIL